MQSFSIIDLYMKFAYEVRINFKQSKHSFVPTKEE